MTNSIRDILQNFEQQVVTGHGGATLKHHAEAEQAINAYILGEVMELINSCYDKDYGIDSVALRNKANERWGSDGY